MGKQNSLFSKGGKLLLSLGMMASLFTPYTAYATETTNSDGEKEATTEAPQATQTKEDAGVVPYAYDTTAPVIEKVELEKQGQTVKAKEKLKLFVYAYDDTGIETIEASITFNVKGTEVSKHVSVANFIKTDVENRYELTIDIEKGFDYMYVNAIEVTDKNNISYGKIRGEDGELQYYVNIDETNLLSFQMKSLTLKENNATLKAGDTLHVEAILPDKEAGYVKSIRVVFQNDSSSRYEDVELVKEEGTNRYVGKREINDTTPVGNYQYYYAQAYIDDTYQSYTMTLEETASITFKIEGETDNESPVITSIDIDKKGKVLNPGDKVTMTVKAKDNVALRKDISAWAYFYAYAQSLTNHISIELNYNEEKDAFVGTYEITDTTYPCEWVLQDISISDTSDNYTRFYEFSETLEEQDPFYFYVQNDGKLLRMAYDVTINLYTMKEYGNYEMTDTINRKVTRRSTIAQAGIKLPEPSAPVEGMKFIGWRDYEGNEVDLSKPVMYEQYHSLYATYDKVAVKVFYTYPTKDGEIKSTSEQVLIEQGSTYQDVINQVKGYKPEDLHEGAEFAGWYSQGYLDPTQEVCHNGHLNLHVDYKDKKALQLTKNYFDVNGYQQNQTEIIFIDKTMQNDQATAYFEKMVAPELYPGLRFKEWNVFAYSKYEHLSSVYLGAEYENALIRFFVDDAFRPTINRAAIGGGIADSDVENIYFVVAELGETFKVPDMPEYKKVTWVFHKPVGENLIAQGNMTFYGYGDKADGSKPVVKPDPKPENPETPETPEIPETPKDDVIHNIGAGDAHLSEEVVKNLSMAVDYAQPGQKLDIPMNGATFVPVELLAAAKGKDVTLNLDMGGYTWSINGMDIMATNLAEINLEVSFDTNAVEDSIVKELAGDNPVKQLSLTHNGNFGFKANLSFNIGKEYEGKYGNLYYYDSNGTMNFMNAGAINEDGTVSLEFSHASDYVIVISDTIMEKENPIQNTGAQASDQAGMLAVMSLAGLGLYFYFKKKETVMETK